MRLIIQIPCYNEAESLPRTLADLPRAVEGFTDVQHLVIDDGSTDRTGEVAREHGVDHVVRHTHNCGLAAAFMTGLAASLDRGADVIVNTDADLQYPGREIHRLVRPILERQADIVIGARPIGRMSHFSRLKRGLQGLGSRMVRTLSETDVRDAPSGFRALTRDAALRLNVFTSYTYTLETIIQAGLSNLRVLDVPIEVNPPTRPSRLIRSTAGYVGRSFQTMLSAYLIYKPVRLFGALSALFLAPGVFLAGRYVYLVLIGEGRGHVQSVIAAGVLATSALFMAAIAVVAHLLAINRRLLEELRYRERLRGGGSTRSNP